MSNQHDSRALAHLHASSQAFWMTSAGRRLESAQRACLGPVIESRNKGHGLELSMSHVALLSVARVPHAIRFFPDLELADRPSSLVCPPDALALPDGCMDVTLLHHWHEHLADPAALIREAARVTADQGVLIIFGFNPLSLARLSRLIRPARHAFPEQAQEGRADWMLPSRLSRWLGTVDFTTERVDYLGYCLNAAPPGAGASHGPASETWGRRYNVPVGAGYMVRATRRRASAPTRRVEFNLNPLQTPQRLGLSRESLSHDSLSPGRAEQRHACARVPSDPVLEKEEMP